MKFKITSDSTCDLSKELLESLDALIKALRKKETEFDGVIKMGRTQLQDAVPVRLGQEFGAYASMLERSQRRIINSLEELTEINLGGTAIGTRPRVKK